VPAGGEAPASEDLNISNCMSVLLRMNQPRQ
jgi:hypothetical protein